MSPQTKLRLTTALNLTGHLETYLVMTTLGSKAMKVFMTREMYTRPTQMFSFLVTLVQHFSKPMKKLLVVNLNLENCFKSPLVVNN